MSDEMFDYVIVGAGTAGCVLAERLSRDPTRRVLLLEAGPSDTNPMIHMPKGVAKVIGDVRYVWPFQVGAGQGSNAAKMTWVRGKTLGGSSSINGMMYVRGQPADFAELARLAGADWDWSHVSRVYREMEHHVLGEADTRGVSGPLRISMPARNCILDGVIASGSAVGLAVQPDVNAPDDLEKIGYCPRTIWHGRRQSAAVAFLRRAAKRPNLVIVTDALGDRVTFDQGRTTGIEAVVSGVKTSFSARRVILSGGTFGSPAILQRSGIGARERLDALDIETLVDRTEVGENLREHCALAMQWRLRGGPSQNRGYSGWRLLLNGIRYYVSRTGPLAGGAYDVGGWFKTRPDLDRPNAQLIAAPYSIDRSKTVLAMEREPGMQIAVYPLRPRATGQAHIASRDAATPPTISLDFYSNPEDRREMVEAVRFVRQLVASGPLSSLVECETRPGPDSESDEEIMDAYRKLANTAYHAVGTCRMGMDEHSVVDPQTRVRGVEGLHVVDLSIAPFVIAGNTFAPTAAIAWRSADLIIGSA